jgi:hypothetical protein
MKTTAIRSFFTAEDAEDGFLACLFSASPVVNVLSRRSRYSNSFRRYFFRFISGKRSMAYLSAVRGMRP